MDQLEEGLYRRQDSRYWWINATLPTGKRIRTSSRTESKTEAQAYLAKLKHEAYLESYLGIKPKRSWKEAVVRYLAIKSTLRSYGDVRRIVRKLDPYVGHLMLHEITGDIIWSITQGQLEKGNKPATVNRYLATIRALLRMARDEWQWIDHYPKVRLLGGEVERDRWLTRQEANHLIACCPEHLSAIVRFALATGCRASEITGLEWNRVDLSRQTAWINQTKNGTPRGIPLNADAVEVLNEQVGKHPQVCFTYKGKPIGWELSNGGWHKALEKANIQDFRFHDLRHTWASWHRQAGTSCDELKDLGGWKSREMVDRYAKFATDNLQFAASRIEAKNENKVISFSRSGHVNRKMA